MSSFLALKLFKLKPSWLARFWADFGFPLTFKCPLSGRVAPMLWWLGDGFLEILMERSSKALVPQLGIYLCMSTLRRWLREQSWWDLRLETKWCAASLSHSQRVGLWVCQCGCWKGPLKGHIRDNLMTKLINMWPARRASSEAAASSTIQSRNHATSEMKSPRVWAHSGSDRGGFGRMLSLEIFEARSTFLEARKNGGNFCTWSLLQLFLQKYSKIVAVVCWLFLLNIMLHHSFGLQGIAFRRRQRWRSL